MSDKHQLMQMMKEEFDRWEELIAGLSEERLNTPQPDSIMSIKDVLAHLMAWQQRSIARLEAALHNSEPEFPKWPTELLPDSEEEGDPDKINAWIYQTYHDRSWTDVHRMWRDGFLRFMELGEAISEKDLFDTEKYRWLEGYSPSSVMVWSYEHHHIEHLEPLLAWMNQSGNMEAE